MRILQIVNIAFEAGGAEKSVRILRDGLTARGHEVRVVATDKLLTGEQEVFADHLIPAVEGRGAAKARGYLWHPAARRGLERILADFRPDCVHLHTVGEFSPAVFTVTRDYPRVLTVHGPESWTRDLLRWNLPSATAGSLSAPDRALLAYLRLVQRPAFLPLVRRVDRVLAPSRYFAEAVRPDVRRVPVHVLPNGIERLAEASPVSGARRLVYVGRLERVKGVHHLLDAHRRVRRELPDATLAVVGDGRERARLEADAADLVADGAVRFLGWRDEAGVAEQLASASVVVLPSLWPENFPTVALEALQLGRALVGSRVGGIPELIGPDNGALVEPGDPAELARELTRLLGDRELLREMGRASARRSAAYDVDAFVDAVAAHYREVAGARAGRRASASVS
ncbi:glycosyltransferase family 4 protein [Actinospica robiniae]|uniref:glycosyltransferase family 4 protein n=1 Tax=Actinospica robiniae TaxID=304901 RepID=UPI0003F96FE3|nr:glycosyltransferase family 4 protein [Actinospica robiniae]